MPGVWDAVLRYRRDRDSVSVVRFLDDPRLMLEEDFGTKHPGLRQRAVREAKATYAAALKAREPVEVTQGVVRAVVEKDAAVLEAPAGRFVVYPDDTVEPVSVSC